jgi:thioester reductase-like protein
MRNAVELNSADGHFEFETGCLEKELTKIGYENHRWVSEKKVRNAEKVYIIRAKT